MTPNPEPLPIPQLHTDLLSWFDASGRDLPWRLGQEGRRDPYRVWVSEVLLQQTQVARGLLYYQRFLDAFPTVQALAAAPEEAVLKAWEGCGYYARARNLHAAATVVAAQGFPDSYAGWLALRGVGPYTAAALASLSAGEARAVSDGNVRRVLSRLYAQPSPTERWVQTTADRLLDHARPGAWNEALMDLGATICTPKRPDCPRCPLAAHCRALAQGQPTAYPPPKVRTAVRSVQAVALLIGDAQHAHLQRRDGALMGGLWGLPLREVGEGQTPGEAAATLAASLGATLGAPLGTVTHAMTHRHVTLHIWQAQADLPLSAVAERPLPRLDHKALALHSGPARLL